MFKTTGSSGLSASKAFIAENDEVVGDGGRVDETVVDSSKLSKSWKVEKLAKVKKPQKPDKSAKVIGLGESSFLIFDTRLAFTKMSSSHTYDRGLLALVEIFKNWGSYQLQAQSSRCHQLYLWRFRDTKSLNSRQICGASELFQYHFCFNYWQSKANGAADALSCFSSRGARARGNIFELNTQILHPLQSSLAMSTSLDIYTPSAPNFYLRNNRPPFVTSILDMRFGKRRLSPEMLDSWEDVKEVVHHQGLSYVPEIIWTELTSRHHDEDTLALRKLEDLLLRKNTGPTVATYQLEGHQLSFNPHCHWPAYTSHDSGGIAYVYQLEGHESQLGRDCLCLLIGRPQVTTWARLPMSTHWENTSYNSIFVIIDLHNELVQIGWCTQAARDNFRHWNLMPQSPRVSNQDSVFTSKFLFLQYQFWARLWLHAFELIARVSYEKDIILRSRFK